MSGNNNEKPHSLTHMANMGFDQDFQKPQTALLGFDGQNLQRQIADNMAIKVTTVGSVTYLAMAAPGTAQATDKWQVRKIDKSSGIVITWADGDSNFNNVATDLTLLNYS